MFVNSNDKKIMLYVPLHAEDVLCCVFIKNKPNLCLI